MQRIATTNKATDLFGAGKHGFRDGNPSVGIYATEFSAQFCNDVQEEICGIIEAAGIALDPNNRAQLLTALRAAGVFQTPAQFDNTTKAATTEFVQRALGNRNKSVAAGTTMTLSGADSGSLFYLTGVGPYTLTLPPLASVPDGAVFEFYRGGTGIATIQGNGSELIWPSGNSVTSVGLSPGDHACIVKGDGSWYLISGAAQLRYASVFGASLSDSGYQKLPSGLIVQWGLANVSSGNAITFPIAFPSQVFVAVGTVDAGGPLSFALNNVSLTGFTAYHNGGGVNGFRYFATGR